MEALGCSVIRGDSWVEMPADSVQCEKVIDMEACRYGATLAVLSRISDRPYCDHNVSHLRFKESDGSPLW